MYICVCKSITETQIRTAANQKPGLSLGKLCKHLDICNHCGICGPYLRNLEIPQNGKRNHQNNRRDHRDPGIGKFIHNP